MSLSFLHSRGSEAPIKIPAMGLDLFVRMPPTASGGEFCFIETVNAPGGPPRHRHPEAEIFRVIEGRYLYEVDGRRFFAEAGDVVSIPGGAAHGFVNVTDAPAPCAMTGMADGSGAGVFGASGCFHGSKEAMLSVARKVFSSARVGLRRL